MPKKTNDKRVLAGRKKRNDRIRAMFAEYLNMGCSYSTVMDIVVDEFGLSESTISQIINNHGAYK